MKTRLIDKQLQQEMLQTINAYALSNGKAIDSRVAAVNSEIPVSLAVSYTHLTLPTNREV